MSRKTQIGWMAVGVVLTLFSVGLTLKLRDGNKVVAREDDYEKELTKFNETPPPAQKEKEAKPLPALDDKQDATTPPVPPPSTFVPPVLAGRGVPPPLASEVPPDAPKGPPPIAPSDTGKPLPPIKFKEPTPAQGIVVTPPIKPAAPAPPIEMPAVPTPVATSALPPASVPVQVAPPVPPSSFAETKPTSKPDFSPRKEVVPVGATANQEPGEPPMVVPSGPVQVYQVRTKAETLADIARRTLGASERAGEIMRLNPDLKPESVLAFGTTVRLPADACIQEDQDAVKPLPSLRPRSTPSKPKILPLTGTFPCNLDERKILTLPKGMREQLGNCETLLVSPGPDNCLWITNHAHLERLSERIEQSPAKEADVRVFKRLYYAQTEKASVTAEGRIALSDRLAQFAGLGQELVIVGIDEHFEVWDAAHWKLYTQQMSAAARSDLAEE